jgi:hypothetical protein
MAAPEADCTAVPSADPTEVDIMEKKEDYCESFVTKLMSKYNIDINTATCIAYALTLFNIENDIYSLVNIRHIRTMYNTVCTIDLRHIKEDITHRVIELIQHNKSVDVYEMYRHDAFVAVNNWAWIRDNTFKTNKCIVEFGLNEDQYELFKYILASVIADIVAKVFFLTHGCSFEHDVLYQLALI